VCTGFSHARSWLAGVAARKRESPAIPLVFAHPPQPPVFALRISELSLIIQSGFTNGFVLALGLCLWFRSPACSHGHDAIAAFVCSRQLTTVSWVHGLPHTPLQRITSPVAFIFTIRTHSTHPQQLSLISHTGIATTTTTTIPLPSAPVWCWPELHIFQFLHKAATQPSTYKHPFPPSSYPQMLVTCSCLLHLPELQATDVWVIGHSHSAGA